MYKGQPVPSQMFASARAKVGDGKSVVVTVPENTTIESGKFYALEGFFGAAVQSVTTKAGETAQIVLLIEQAEYETDQITVADAFAKGDVVYFDDVTELLTTGAGTDNRRVGRITMPKDGNNVIYFLLGPQ